MEIAEKLGNNLLGINEGNEMAIANYIEKVRQGLREGRFTSEAAVSQGILLPALHELGWPVFDTSIVIPEFSVEGRRVDYALSHPENRPSVFIEVKKVGLSEGADRQLFEYAFHLGVPMAILTDGQEWSFYLPGEQGRYDERRVYKLDLLERDITEAESRLDRYLSYSNVCSGDALKAARSDYQNVARVRIVEANLPKAWEGLLKDQDSLLLDLLGEKVEDLCGYKPELDVCGQFLEMQIQNSKHLDKYEPEKKLPMKKGQPFNSTTDIIRTRIVDNFTFVFKGKEFPARSAREVMTKLFQLLSQEDKGFLDRFASRKHGKKRRYLAKDKRDLYPGRLDLAEQHSVEIVAGWWLGTNYSRRNIQDIIELALEVAGPQFRNLIRANVL
jgi:predicted type IV restriction endonuclease